MIKKNKWSFLLLFLPSLILVSCSTQESKSDVPLVALEHNKSEELTPAQQHEKEWQTFLNNQVISNLLDLVFLHTTEKEGYINSQKFLDSEEYSKLIKGYLYYYNYSNMDSDGIPYAYSVALEKITNLFSKNWLWFLFYVNKIYFMKIPNINNQDSSQIAFIRKSNSENSSFYRPQSNVFFDIVYKKIEDNLDKPISEVNEYSKKYQILIKNQDNFVFTINVVHTYNNLKNKIKNTSVFLSPYILIPNKNWTRQERNLNLENFSKEIFSNEENQGKNEKLIESNAKFYYNLKTDIIAFVFSDLIFKNKEKR
ncbi:aromatic motif membrane protein [Mesomycoplasma hyorhinis]|uniref:aromatic motif membrane protein n=1 Tax=Mesomycoplasma hyorhinis TaxID=2100 RepID=UPI003DA429C6